jgi:hypothetical protein
MDKQSLTNFSISFLSVLLVSSGAFVITLVNLKRCQGPILQNPISAENILHSFSP